ncbi:MAG: S1C family serine protease [Gaiellaceae bacterium]
MEFGALSHGALFRVSALVAAGMTGGAAALGGAALVGDLGHTTTVHSVIETQESTTPASFAGGKALTIHDVYVRAAPGVVQITSTSVVTVPQDPFFGNPFAPQTEQQQSLGSGFVIDKAGHIVTNYHVVAGARSVQVSFSNGENVKARVVGTDPSTDIAVLQVDAHSRAFTPLQWGNSDNAQVGDSVVAIGNPFGYTRTVTAGIVSAVDRPLSAPNNFIIDHAIQTDAALNHGNSGGPLLDTRGLVIGVNSQISTGNTGQQGNLGIGFAIPSNTVRTVVSELIKTGRAEHAYLGIKATGLTPQIAQLFHLPVGTGLLVQTVEPHSAAAAAGLKAATTQVTVAGETWPLGGDIIVAADGTPTPSVNKLAEVIAAHKPGETLELSVYRGTTKKTIEVKLGRQPSSP